MNKKEIKKALFKSIYIEHYPIKFKVFKIDNSEIINSNNLDNAAYISFQFSSNKKYKKEEIIYEFKKIFKDAKNINLYFHELKDGCNKYYAFIYLRDIIEINKNPEKEIYFPNHINISKSSKSAYIYILKLQSDKYYVGTTRDYERRFKQHVAGTGFGSSWTKKYKPINIINVYELENMSLNKSCDWEDYITREMILKYGYENVRGGKFIRSVEINKSLMEKPSIINRINAVNKSFLIKIK